MKKHKIISLLLIIYLTFAISSRQFFAEERSIYVGDLIELKIQAEDLTLDELKNKFKDFEIVNVTDIPKGYIITLRTFESGERTISIGDKELKIVVKSTLDEIEREDIYEGDLQPLEPGFYIKWKYVLIPLVIVFILSLAINIKTLLMKRKKSLMTPYERFKKAIGDLSVEQKDYLVNLTRIFKEYLESTCSYSIKGKTSTEILYEISRMPQLNEKLPEIKSWLSENDYFKFSGTPAPMAKKLELMERLTSLVDSIEEVKKGEAK
ncbi:hypothetical protein [Acetivibrio clariflavus]|uniref:DUF4129 domain-containing protein n=1 Tax=Acetivibrio clariflavus (strain DSM 19732 / NBRC 101661 / EBR45) TaxID=720554 RepID=G8LZE5_ACECE|nr:hypothetical protein [Acetivibrio clariflavus]AEV66808.1 hypothetical protein Clocl_0050 [Acetivibrio clariflavus DSM 19732]